MEKVDIEEIVKKIVEEKGYSSEVKDFVLETLRMAHGQSRTANRPSSVESSLKARCQGEHDEN